MAPCTPLVKFGEVVQQRGLQPNIVRLNPGLELGEMDPLPVVQLRLAELKVVLFAFRQPQQVDEVVL